MKNVYKWLSLFILFCIPFVSTASNAHFSGNGKDSCAVNDLCSTAIELQVHNDLGFTCVTGCTDLSTAELFDNLCRIGQYPTVWYRIQTEVVASIMSIDVESDEIHSLSISLFLASPDCDHLLPVALSGNNFPCLEVIDGIAKVQDTKISGGQIYFIAITDQDNNGGTFELCVNTLSSGLGCFTNNEIEITSRSNGGPLTGPFEPGETISICFNVNAYSAINNGCQWFQGMIPVFGNGWDPNSFDANGQPLHATINGKSFGIEHNGINPIATWDWFVDVDYHFDNPNLHVQDFDHNGTVDICNSLYDPHCTDPDGIQGGCCGPCWQGTLGTILPPGWFAYGVNGVCPTPGPPIRVDWGDGTTCGAGMGPWKFCFDLETRTFPDCHYDQSTTDLSLGFFTLTDGETGSWVGTPQFCNDPPAYWKPGFRCGTEKDLGTVTLPNQCSGNLVTYELYEPGVYSWEWTVTPSDFVNDSIFEGPNGHILESHPYYTGSSSTTVLYNLIGHLNSGNTVIKKINFRVWPQIQFQLPEYIKICEHKPGTVTIIPSLIKGGKPPYNYFWKPGGDTFSSLVLHAPFQSEIISLVISDTIGCITKDSLLVKLKSCQIDDPGNEPNDTINPEPPLPNDENFTFPEVNKYNRSIEEFKSASFQIHPTPTSGIATVTWSFDLQQDATIEIFNVQGFRLKKFPVYANEEHQKQIDTQSLTSGVYFVSFGNGEFRYVTRLVKM
jgi:hypothetical protein